MNDFLFIFDLKSVGYKEKEKGQINFQLICPLWLPNLDLNQGPSD